VVNYPALKGGAWKKMMIPHRSGATTWRKGTWSWHYQAWTAGVAALHGSVAQRLQRQRLQRPQRVANARSAVEAA